MDKKNYIKGICYIVISAIGFGVMPILAKLAYRGGANAVTTLWLRFTFAALILLYYIKDRKLSLKLNKIQIKYMLVVGLLSSLTSVLLFSSYNYISTGMATTIIYCYPVIVMVLSVIIYKEKLKPIKIICLLFTLIGMFIMMDINSSIYSNKGLFMVIGAALCYAVYIIAASNKNLVNIDSYVTTFYISVISGVIGLITGVASNELVFHISFYGLISIVVLAFISTIVALKAFIQGVKMIGASNAAIFSTLEPIVSLILGILILGEPVNTRIIIGSILIIGAMILLAKGTVKEHI